MPKERPSNPPDRPKVEPARRCRHRTLVEHFGQELETNAETGCGACDVCLGEVVALPGSTLIARKILSAVARVEQSFGIGHVVKVLRTHTARTHTPVDRPVNTTTPMTDDSNDPRQQEPKTARTHDSKDP